MSRAKAQFSSAFRQCCPELNRKGNVGDRILRRGTLFHVQKIRWKILIN